tara:strand:- start:13356 stop:14876 length:1521 start_codon:yes stop_codon:yes gene_type:complete
MALLDGQIEREYYESGSFGNYQFVSLQDVIAQFMAIYVGEEKIINKVGRTEVAFHAQRALAELSFDTLKAFKSQSIVLPPSLVMALPHDYVNYTKLSWCDAAGIKHPLYKTNDTSNPFQIEQESDGTYIFNTSLSDSFKLNKNNNWIASPPKQLGQVVGLNDFTQATSNDNDKLIIEQHPTKRYNMGSYVTYCYQKIDVTDYTLASLEATAVTVAASTQVVTADDFEPYSAGSTTGTFNTPATTVRVGLSTSPPSTNVRHNPTYSGSETTNRYADYYDIAYLEWTAGETGEKIIDEDLDFTDIEGDVYLTIICIAPWVDNNTNVMSRTLKVFSEVSGVRLESILPTGKLTSTNSRESSTWDKYKAITPAENNNDDYANDDYQRVPDERYGLDPSRAQTNGSFYIDDRIGRIHFSSNISGKTVILDYISDSLGTEAEMQIHKLAEEAMYKSISYGVLSVKSNIPEYVVMRARKEKIAATRKAKLRLSNIKIEDITQVLRGKSKHIKH